jgi:hypothetical protein
LGKKTSEFVEFQKVIFSKLEILRNIRPKKSGVSNLNLFFFGNNISTELTELLFG